MPNITNKQNCKHRYLIVDKNCRCHYSTAIKDSNQLKDMDRILPKLKPFTLFDRIAQLFINFLN